MLKNKLFSLSLPLVAVFMMAPSQSLAGTAGKTESLLIDKLTKVFLKLPEGSPTKSKLTLRLADLHAERGRLLAKEDLENGCVECTAGKEDRKQALEYYQYVLQDLNGERKHRVMVQVGHLYEVLGENSKATGFYKKVVASGQGAAEAHFSLAEIYFKQRNFSLAKSHYLQALQDEDFPRKGLATFRLAWCHYNIGEIAQAVNTLEKMLNSPKLLTRNSNNVVNVDEDFKAEVAKDYTVFLAHDSRVSMADISKVFNLSPRSSRIENVSFLAKELERLGRNQQSEEAFELLIEKTSDPEVRMEALVYLANLKLKGKQKTAVLPYLKRAFRNWRSLDGCKNPKQCEELKSRVRTLVFDWNRMEKKNPSPELIEAYENYFLVEKEDMKAYELSSQAAVQTKDWEKAYAWNKKAFQLAKTEEQKETLLLRRIEIAELAKKKAWLAASQKLYLQKSTKQNKAPEIRYQMAQNAYDQGQTMEAAEQFRSLALSKKTPAKLRNQSAELALDSLVLAKQDQKIETWAREFANIFPKNRKHFLSLAGQSVLSQTAKLSDKASASEQAWKTLNRFDVASSTPEKKKTFYKNKIILARKLRKFSEMDKALRSYLSLKALEKEERQFALENKVWLSELQLNFDEAFRSYREINKTDWLELARLADLAEKDSSPYFYNYIRNTEDPELAHSICIELIREAKSFGSKQKSCVPYLKRDKNLFAGLLLEIYQGKKSSSQILRVFKSYGLEQTAPAHVLRRDLLLAEGTQKLKRLKDHKLDRRPSQVGNTLQHRMSRISNFEDVIAKASKTGDWLTQTLFLTELAEQYSRFFEDLMSLPTPKGLTAEEQQEYVTLLSQQAAPYKEKAQEIQFKVEELWKNEKAMQQIFANFHQSPIEVQKILGPQIERIRERAPTDKKVWMSLVYRDQQQKRTPSFARLEMARKKVKENPLSKQALRDLIKLETARGNKPMIIYLNSRMKMVDNGFESKERSL